MKGTCRDLAALFLACSPRRSYRAVVLTFACPTNCWTIEMSTPASRRSETQDRRRSCGENGRTFAFFARVWSMA